MVELLVSPSSVAHLAQTILMLVVTTYLVRVPGKSHATRWLIVSLAAFMVIFLCLFLQDTLFGLDPRGLDLIRDVLVFVVSLPEAAPIPA